MKCTIMDQYAYLHLVYLLEIFKGASLKTLSVLILKNLAKRNRLIHLLMRTDLHARLEYCISNSYSELNGMRKNICLKIQKFMFKKQTVSNVTEKLVEHSIYCLLCSYTIGVMFIIIPTMSHWWQNDVIGITF